MKVMIFFVHMKVKKLHTSGNKGCEEQKAITAS